MARERGRSDSDRRLFAGGSGRQGCDTRGSGGRELFHEEMSFTLTGERSVCAVLTETVPSLCHKDLNYNDTM